MPRARIRANLEGMTAQALARMAANGGLLTRPQARDCGVSDLMIKHLVGTGRWVLVRRGVYADAEHWNSLDLRGRERLRTRAAMLMMKRDHVASHDSAGHEHGLGMLTPSELFVHVTRPGVTNARVQHGIKVHLARYAVDQVVPIDGIKVLDVARTAVDIAREHGSPYGEVACDSAMRLGVSRRELMEACAPMEYWPYITRTRTAVDFADPRAESVAETLGRILVGELGLGEPDLQFPVRLINGKVIWADLRIGCHVFEVHGKVKFTPVEEGGFATSSPTEVAWASRKRDRDYRDVGLGVSNIVWADFYSGRREAIKRLRREYADTVAMFGDTLPAHLARQAAELRGQRSA